MHDSLLFLVPLFLIALGVVTVYHTFSRLSPYQKQQVANQQLRNAILKKKVMSTLEAEKKYIEYLKILDKKIHELKREIAIQKQIREQ